MFSVKQKAHEFATANGISLEQSSVVVSDEENAKMDLVICVANWAYQKEVFCRITFNNWQTHSDYCANYQYSSPDHSIDFFLCEIPCNLR